MDDRARRHADRLRALGQHHVLAFWDDLNPDQREALLDDLDRVPYPLIERVRDAGIASLEPAIPDLTSLSPVEARDIWEDRPEVQRAAGIGVEALRAGHVAAVTVAGGQGSRLGYDGPKGAFPVGPVSGHSFYRIIAEGVIGASRRYETTIPWYVMTSDATHEATEAYFRDHDAFGLRPGQLRLFRQGSMPALSPEGRILLADRHRLALSPDGHGGLLSALSVSGCLDRMAEEGTRHLSVFQVDNPMVRWFHPAFVGWHVSRGADISCKSLSKREDKEGLGNFCRRGRETLCIEYSDFPDSHATARNPDGSRKYDTGNLSIYVMRVGFLERLASSGAELPIHLARKKVAHVDPATGGRVEPAEPNAIKMERFIFDVLPHADTVEIVKTRREEEFGPVKVLEGKDSVQTCQAALVQRACRWLEAAGVQVPRAPDGTCDATVEISPLRAQGAEDLVDSGDLPERVAPGQLLYIS